MKVGIIYIMPRSTVKQTEAKTEAKIEENEIVIEKVKKTKSRTKANPEEKQEEKPEEKQEVKIEEKPEEKQEEEIWRDINTEDEAVEPYKISNLGRIKNKRTGTILKYSISATNRPSVKLGKIGKNFQVNTLMGKTFLEYPKLEENQIVHVTHIDGNPHNVRADNLKIEIKGYNKSNKESIEETYYNPEYEVNGFKGKEIEGYNNYMISNDGQIYSISRKILIKPLTEDLGYKRVLLQKNSKGAKFYIHRLVAIAYIPNPENYDLVNHKDSNKHNNTVENLEWCSASMNMKHNAKVKNQGRRVIQYNEETGKEIARYDTIKEASEKTGTEKTSIIHCCAKRNKRAGGFVWRYEGDELVEKENKENSDSDD